MSKQFNLQLIFYTPTFFRFLFSTKLLMRIRCWKRTIATTLFALRFFAICIFLNISPDTSDPIKTPMDADLRIFKPTNSDPDCVFVYQYQAFISIPSGRRSLEFIIVISFYHHFSHSLAFRCRFSCTLWDYMLVAIEKRRVWTTHELCNVQLYND